MNEERYKNQGKYESKSNYEKYAEKKQQELLKKEVSLSFCISWLKENAKIYGKDYMEAQQDIIAQVFGLNSSEIRDAAAGEQYWCI